MSLASSRPQPEAGFAYVGESKVLRNPADGLKVKVFDKSIRGRTDQFLQFTVANLSPYTLESRSDDTFSTAVPLDGSDSTNSYFARAIPARDSKNSR